MFNDTFSYRAIASRARLFRKLWEAIMIAALVTGALFKAPESRTSKNGKPFVTATIRAKDGDATTFIRVVVFIEALCTELLKLKGGDYVTIQGPLKAELYKPEGGESKLSLSIVADHALALRQPPKDRAS
jgi:single-stranded DNA-binding protein